MADLRELYQEIIIEHGRQPRNFARLENANRIQEGFNPVCGDKIILFLKEDNNVIQQVTFDGCGCAISMASASLMTEALQGKTINDAEQLIEHFHELVTLGQSDFIENNFEKLTVLSGVCEYPVRVKCATLAWHTLKAAIRHENKPVTTEES